MLDILIRACSFIAIIVMGYLLKKIGFFKKEDFGILSKIAIRLTLPCAIIVSFNGKVIDPALLSLPVLAQLPFDPNAAALCDAGEIEKIENPLMMDAARAIAGQVGL